MDSTRKLDKVLTMMVQGREGISDLLFIPGMPPQVERNGVLETPPVEWPECHLANDHVEDLARTIINGNSKLLQDLAEHGSCDCSYSLPDVCRFRVNIYRENGSLAMVLRMLQTEIPSIESLGLDPVFREVVKGKNGIVFITGASGNGKTTVLAAMLNEINRTNQVHIITLEDPVEFLHPHLLATFSQRELGRDFFSFSEGLRAAFRQAPKVILVGEIRDRETMENALVASETGHAVFSTLHTVSAGQTINRILGMFDEKEEQQVRSRLASALRYIIGLRLVPKITGGRYLVTEFMGQNLRTQEAIELGEKDNCRLTDIIEAGQHAGWHSFEQSLLKAFRNDLITEETAMLYATNKSAMRQLIDSTKTQNHHKFLRANMANMIIGLAS